MLKYPLSHDEVSSNSVIHVTPCIKIDKPLVNYIFGNSLYIRQNLRVLTTIHTNLK